MGIIFLSACISFENGSWGPKLLMSLGVFCHTISLCRCFYSHSSYFHTTTDQEKINLNYRSAYGDLGSKLSDLFRYKEAGYVHIYTCCCPNRYIYLLFRITKEKAKYILNRVGMWILSQLLHLAGQRTTIIPVFSGPVVCAFPELFHQLLFDK